MSVPAAFAGACTPRKAHLPCMPHTRRKFYVQIIGIQCATNSSSDASRLAILRSVRLAYVPRYYMAGHTAVLLYAIGGR